MKTIIVLFVALLLSGITNLTGQEKEVVLSKNSVATLAMGIHSENTGLKKSAIQMIGRYKLKQVCPILIEQFTNETELNYQLLIAEMIYDVGCVDAIDSFRTVVSNEKIDELQYFCRQLHENYVFANNLSSN